MTKKHFVELADALRRSRPGYSKTGMTDAETAARVQWQACVDSIAEFCLSQNPRFQRNLWLAYIAGECGPGGEQLKQ